jgi:hypothetical protein
MSPTHPSAISYSATSVPIVIAQRKSSLTSPTFSKNSASVATSTAQPKQSRLLGLRSKPWRQSQRSGDGRTGKSNHSVKLHPLPHASFTSSKIQDHSSPINPPFSERSSLWCLTSLPRKAVARSLSACGCSRAMPDLLDSGYFPHAFQFHNRSGASNRA